MDVDFPLFCPCAQYILVLDHCLPDQPILVRLCLHHLTVLVGCYTGLALVFMQQTDVSGLYVGARSLPFPVGEEIWENVDLPFLPSGAEDILDILLETQLNNGQRRFLDDWRWRQ